MFERLFFSKKGKNSYYTEEFVLFSTISDRTIQKIVLSENQIKGGTYLIFINLIKISLKILNRLRAEYHQTTENKIRRKQNGKDIFSTYIVYWIRITQPHLAVCRLILQCQHWIMRGKYSIPKRTPHVTGFLLLLFWHDNCYQSKLQGCRNHGGKGRGNQPPPRFWKIS